ncbi:MAG: IS110 family transposase [Candidatus Paceibacterota bacterium]|jgi:transposase
MKMYLGIDLHKKSGVWVMMDEKRNVVWHTSVASHPFDISASIAKIPAPLQEVKVAIEPVCGWRWVTKQLEEAGFEVHIAHPMKVRLIAESKQKTDFNDARTLADLLRAGMLPESHRVSDEKYELRVVLRERCFLVKERTAVKNRLHGIVTTEGLHLVDGRNPLQKRGKKWIEEGSNETMKELLKVIAELDVHIDLLAKKISGLTKEIPEAKLLITMPGIGPITALTVVAEVGDFSRFSSPKKLASFAGIVPKQRSSGEKVRLGSITHQGSKYLRTTMVEAAMRIRECSAPELFRFITDLTPNCGAKRARVALARKMLAIMWTMIQNKTPYDPAIMEQARLSRLSSAIRKESYLDIKRGA